MIDFGERFEWPPLPPGLYRDSLLWRSNGASPNQRPPLGRPFLTFASLPYEPQKSYRDARDVCRAQDKAGKCESSIAIEMCRVAISQEAVTFACMRELQNQYGIWNIEQELEAAYWDGAKNLISTTVYGIAWKSSALADMEELQIQKSSDLPNNSLIFRDELQIGYIMEPSYSIWSCNRTTPFSHKNFVISFTTKKHAII